VGAVCTCVGVNMQIGFFFDTLTTFSQQLKCA